MKGKRTRVKRLVAEIPAHNPVSTQSFPLWKKLLEQPPRTYVIASLAASALIVLLSWYRAWYAGALIVDGYNFNGIHETLGFWVYTLSLLVFCLSYYVLWYQQSLGLNSIRTLAYAQVAIFSLMLPMLSNDIFSLIAYGDAANGGKDVFIDTNALYSTEYFDYVSKFWRHAPCAYGPVCLVTARLSAWLGDGSMVTALIVYKVTAVFWAALFIEMAVRVVILLRAPSRKLLFVLLSPFFLIQGVAQLHCDAMAATLALCGVYFVFTQRWYIAFAFGALCVAVKINYVLVFPFLIVGLFIVRNDGWLQFFRRAAIATAVYLGTFVVVYMGVYKSPETFMVTFRFVFEREPSKSISEIVGGAIYYSQRYFNGDIQAMQNGLEGIISPQQIKIWNIVKNICQVLALITGLYIFYKFWTGKRGLKQWFRVYVRLMLLFLLFFSHIFFAWYIMLILPFMWVDEGDEFMHWLFALSFLVNMQDVVCMLSRNSTVYFISLALTVLSILAYMWKFPTMFLTSLGYGWGKKQEIREQKGESRT